MLSRRYKKGQSRQYVMHLPPSIDEYIKILPSQLIRFSGNSQRPSKLVGDALCKMGLNYWGVVKELTVAMSEFDSKATTGKRAASVFFTI